MPERVKSKAPSQHTRCIHCFNPAGKTRDHVFPASWYPESTPSDVQRPVAPSCGPCNGSFGAQENYLLQRLGLGLDPTIAESAGIPAKALRAVGVGVEAELSRKEKAIRAALMRKIAQETIAPGDIAKGSGILPGFGPKGNLPLSDQIGLRIDSGKLEAVCGKIIRGLEYSLEDRYIEEPYSLGVHFIHKDADEALMAKFGSPAAFFGPGFNVQRVWANDDPRHVLYRIEVWGTLIVHGSIIVPRS